MSTFCEQDTFLCWNPSDSRVSPGSSTCRLCDTLSRVFTASLTILLPQNRTEPVYRQVRLTKDDNRCDDADEARRVIDFRCTTAP